MKTKNEHIEDTTDSLIPDWLMAPDPDDAVFTDSFNETLEQIASGIPLMQIFDQTQASRFLTWVRDDSERSEAYSNALKIKAELLFEQLPEIGCDSSEDTNRSRLKFEIVKYCLSKLDRDRFADVKKIDQVITVDIAEAMKEAQKRLEIKTLKI